ncbi:MAG: GHKL domain-containing protein [Lachnospiraceae bacterium]|nr:GHKL domain-containing protein [Lachnospiraceae bacterium]
METISSINTPGIYYAIGYILASFVVVLTYPKRRSPWYTLLWYVVYFVILAPVITSSTGVIRIFIPLVLFYFGLMYATVMFNIKTDLRTGFFITMRAFLIGEFFASFEWLVYYMSVNIFHYPRDPFANVLMLLLVYGLMFPAFLALEQHLHKNNKHFKINSPELVISIFILIAIYILSNISYLVGNQIFGGTYAMVIFVVRTITDLSGLAIFYAYYLQLGEIHVRLERDRLLDDLEMQYTNYEVLEKSMEVVNIKYHDLKHQIALLKEGLSNKDEAMDYLNKMEDEIRIYEAQNKTGNKVLDTILTAKSVYCQNHWIDLTCVAEGEALNFIDPMDLSALFGNLLDNAIESVEKIESKEKRLIHLAVSHQKGFVKIRLENRYEKEPTIKNGKVVTSKSDKRYHGYGLKSIEKTVKKYGGSVTFSAKDGWFESRILIPQQYKKENDTSAL